MPETPEELYARARDALRMPPVEDRDTLNLATFKAALEEEFRASRS